MLLWHGTGVANLLSILTTGLQVIPVTRVSDVMGGRLNLIN